MIIQVATIIVVTTVLVVAWCAWSDGRRLGGLPPESTPVVRVLVNGVDVASTRGSHGGEFDVDLQPSDVVTVVDADGNTFTSDSSHGRVSWQLDP